MRTIVLLAGGKSSRMGQDKVMLPIDGKTFIEHSYEKALSCFDRIIISTDTEEHAKKIRSLPLFVHKNPEIAIDLYPEAGPIGGLLSVFEQMDVQRFSIISVDVPHASMQVLKELFDRCTKKACFLRIGDRKSEPLIAAWDRSAYCSLKACFDEGLYKLRRVLEPEDVTIVADRELKEIIPEVSGDDFERIFRNFNTQEELKKLYD